MSQQRLARRLVLASAALVVAGCFRAPAGVTETDRAEWVADVVAKRVSATATCPASLTFGELRAALSARVPAVEVANALALADRLQAEAVGPDDLQLRLSNVRVDRVFEGEPTADVALRMPLARPGTLAAREHLLRLRAKRHEAEGRRLGAEVATRAARLAAQAHYHADRATAAATELSAAQARFAAVDAKIKAGAATARERDRAQQAVQAAESSLAVAKADAAASRRAIGRAAGLSPGCEPTVVASAATDRGPSAAARDNAIAADPRLDAALLAVAEAETERFLVEARRYPWIDFAQLGWELESPVEGDAFTVMLSVSLPLFSLGDAPLDAADARIRAAKLQAEAVAAERVDAIDALLATADDATRRLQALSAGQAAAAQLLATIEARRPVDHNAVARQQTRVKRLDEQIARARRDALEATLTLEAMSAR